MSEDIVDINSHKHPEESEQTADTSPLSDTSPEINGNLSADEYFDKWIRAVAEVENTKKRMNRELKAARREERDALLRAMLEILDNVERALTANLGELNPWLDGYESIQSQIQNILRQYGVTQMDTDNERFDPNLHEAVACVQLDHVEPGVIVDTEQSGFQFEDGRVLRPARVIVTQ